ncbi:MAG: preprotein translocase subunit SecG [Azoarcus sp.]|jgi:preprotein translocase subunit SecG|nr:preprotein translocase subunit SecG [Azoarcus sp.]
MGNSTWFNLLLLIQVIAGLGVIGLVLMQHGKGADMGAAFGSGASGSLFGASGSANFLSRTTAVLATVFFVASLGLAYLASHREAAPAHIMEGVSVPAAQEKPAVPAANDSVPAASSAETAEPVAGEGAPSNEGAIPE